MGAAGRARFEAVYDARVTTRQLLDVLTEARARFSTIGSGMTNLVGQPRKVCARGASFHPGGLITPCGGESGFCLGAVLARSTK